MGDNTMRHFYCINLDCASDRTLRRIAKSKTDPRQAVAQRLYEARQLRLRGQINDARMREASAERAIEELPEDLRW